ncbi:MAG TPA: FkbM family methyltransferase [Candidatus Dormibacteraeota bacterium]|nr:FkbM family methyltransferase [Candidatus Dormibacteraeota bacterium]
MSQALAERAGAVAEVTTDLGRIALPAHDEGLLPHLREHGHWRPEEAYAMRRLVPRGAIVLEAGAHVGYQTLLLSRLVGPRGRVIAAEAGPQNAALLRANLERAEAANVAVVEAALGEAEGQQTLWTSERDTRDHHVGVNLNGRGGVQVEVVSGDVLVGSGAVDLVKIAAGGAEYKVVAGLSETIARDRPVLLVDFWPEAVERLGEAPARVLGGYRGLGFGERWLGLPGPAAGADAEAVVAAVRGAAGGRAGLLLIPGTPPP